MSDLEMSEVEQLSAKSTIDQLQAELQALKQASDQKALALFNAAPAFNPSYYIMGIVLLAVFGVGGGVTLAIMGRETDRMTFATMLLGFATSAILGITAAMKSAQASDQASRAAKIAAESFTKVTQLDVKVDGRLSALILSMEKAAAAEKLLARTQGREEGKAIERGKEIAPLKPSP